MSKRKHKKAISLLKELLNDANSNRQPTSMVEAHINDGFILGINAAIYKLEMNSVSRNSIKSDSDESRAVCYRCKTVLR